MFPEVFQSLASSAMAVGAVGASSIMLDGAVRNAMAVTVEDGSLGKADQRPEVSQL